MQETQVRALGWEDSLEKEMAIHSSILAWKIPEATVHGVAKNRTWLSDFISFQGLFTIRACMLSHFSHVPLFAAPWTVSCQAPLSMGFFWQEYWNGFPCPPPGDLPDPRIEPVSLASPALHVSSLPLSHQGSSIYYLKFIKIWSVFFPPMGSQVHRENKARLRQTYFIECNSWDGEHLAKILFTVSIMPLPLAEPKNSSFTAPVDLFWIFVRQLSVVMFRKSLCYT